MPADRPGPLGAKVAGFTVLGLAVLAAVAYAGLWLYAGDRAPRNAAVEGDSVAGLGPGEARDRLEQELAGRARRPITVTFGDGRSQQVDPATAGLSIDYDASAVEAGASSVLTPRRIWDLVTGGSDHRAELAVDADRMEAALDGLDEALGRKPVEGTVAFRDGTAVAVPSQAGLAVSRGPAARLLEREFLRQGSQKVPTQVQQPQVSDEEVARALKEFGTPAMSGPVTLVLGGQRVVAPPRLFGRGLSMVARDGVLVPKVDGEAMLAALQPVMRTVGKEPVDARFEVRRDRPVLVPAKVGVQVDPAALEQQFAQVAVRTGAQRRLELQGKVTQPSFTTAEAKALGITRRVSTFTTYFPYAEYRNVNLPRAAELIDGTVLEPGETFSLNRTVGERTRANGFTEGYVVSDGIFQKDLGGGVSQIATTTFNAMFFAGLEDVQHKPHSVFIDRYPVGREATVAWPTVDLQFRNTTPHGVLIKASVRRSTPTRQGAATVSMYSTKTWDIGARTGRRTAVTEPKTRYLEDPDCEALTGTQGFDVDVFRVFRRVGAAKVVRTEKFHTRYIPRDTVKCGPPPRKKQA